MTNISANSLGVNPERVDGLASQPQWMVTCYFWTFSYSTSGIGQHGIWLQLHNFQSTASKFNLRSVIISNFSERHILRPLARAINLLHDKLDVFCILCKFGQHCYPHFEFRMPFSWYNIKDPILNLHKSATPLYLFLDQYP